MRVGFCERRSEKISVLLILWVVSLVRGVAWQLENTSLDLGGESFLGVAVMAPDTEEATFAAGCFWSVELAFQRVPGVEKTEVGYTQGHVLNPTYEQVCSGKTGHVEAVRLEYNPHEVTYEKLLETFWHKHDPTQLNRQGNDVGTQYRSGIYYHTPHQEAVAKASLKDMERKLGKKIATEVLPAKTFYRSEDYHQQYLEKGGRNGAKQSARKNCNDPIRCYG